MSKVYIGENDVTEQVIGRPRIKVISSIVNGSMYMPETQMQMFYRKGWFDGSDPIFRSGAVVVIRDDDGETIFEGTLRSTTMSYATTDLTCISNLGAFLSGIVQYTGGPAHPALLLADVLDKAGIPNNRIRAQAYLYPGMVGLIGVQASDSMKGCDFLSTISEMMTLDLVVEKGIVVGLPYIQRANSGSIGDIESMMYPQLNDDGVSRWTRV